jgi:hypothetical protein
MIVNDGKVLLLDSQRTYLSALYWGLFTSNTTILAATVWSDLTEAVWTGYARVVAGTWGAPTIVSNVAVSTPTAQPTFTNTSGSSQNFYGWFLYDSSAGKLVAAVNVGLTALPNGASYPLAGSITDNQA